MTHGELLQKISFHKNKSFYLREALRAVVELHKPEHSHSGYRCTVCFIDTTYPCETIESIEKALNG